jgi:hypothetical protein
MIEHSMLAYSKQQKLQYDIVAAVLVIAFAGFVYWVFNENHLVEHEHREQQRRM